jgi:hypothetical protein
MLSDERGVRREEISLDKSVNFDLGMDGDDAVQFFEAFGERLSIDLTSLGEEWDLYFAPEGFSLFGTSEILTLFTARPVPQRGPAIPLPVSRLVDAASRGRWVALKESDSCLKQTPQSP